MGTRIIDTARSLDFLLGFGNEPVQIEISTRKRTFNAILCGVKTDGRFDVMVPQMGDGDSPFEMVYHLDDVIVRFDD